MSRKLQIVPLILAMAFIGVTWIIAGSTGPTRFDVFVLRALSDFRSPGLSTALVWLTELGRTPVVLILSVVFWRRSRLAALHMAAATLGGGLIEVVVKRWIERARPVDILPLVTANGYSFPSGHSMVAAATYTTAAILLCRDLQQPIHRLLVAAAAILVIAIVGVSRVYLGVHYASDAIGGILLGTAWATLLARLFPQNRSAPSRS